MTATLDAALASLGRGNVAAAANQLHAFQNKLQAQVGPQDLVLATTLTRAAQTVLDALSSSETTGLATKLHSLKHSGGKAQLSFTGTAGQFHIVQASTNLVDWEVIGVAVDLGNGSFQFEDSDAASFPRRFYRIISP